MQVESSTHNAGALCWCSRKWCGRIEIRHHYVPFSLWCSVCTAHNYSTVCAARRQNKSSRRGQQVYLDKRRSVPRIPLIVRKLTTLINRKRVFAYTLLNMNTGWRGRRAFKIAIISKSIISIFFATKERKKKEKDFLLFSFVIKK